MPSSHNVNDVGSEYYNPKLRNRLHETGIGSALKVTRIGVHSVAFHFSVTFDFTVSTNENSFTFL
jgi:hypothetical protein